LPEGAIPPSGIPPVPAATAQAPPTGLSKREVRELKELKAKNDQGALTPEDARRFKELRKLRKAPGLGDQ
jgi:hypothetical protein